MTGYRGSSVGWSTVDYRAWLFSVLFGLLFSLLAPARSAAAYRVSERLGCLFVFGRYGFGPFAVLGPTCSLFWPLPESILNTKPPESRYLDSQNSSDCRAGPSSPPFGGEPLGPLLTTKAGGLVLILFVPAQAPGQLG
jgi:hypothetical protein